MSDAVLFFALLLFFQPSGDLVRKSQEAKQLMAAGRYADAIPLYADLVKAAPGNPGLVLNLAMAQHMAGRDKEAVERFEQVLKVQPAAFPALALCGTSYMRLGQPAKAIPLLEKAVAAQPADSNLVRMLADALLLTDRHERAIGYFKKLDEADPRTWFGLGQSYEAMAQKSFEAIAPGTPYWFALVGDSRLKQRRYTAAFAAYSRAAAVPGSHAALAEIYRATNHADWAALEAARERKPDCGSQPLACLYATEKYAEIVASTRLRKTPEALYWRTRALNQLATGAFSRLAQLPPSLELHQVLADVNRNQGRHAEAVRHWREALKLAPGDPHLESELAVSLYFARDYAAAEPLLRSALRREPGVDDIEFYLGDSLVNLQRIDEAIPFLEAARSLTPARAVLGRVLTQIGRAAEAIPHLKAALPLDEDGSLHYQLSRAYQATGQPELAKPALAKYQEMQAASREDPGQITAPAP